MFFNGLNSVMFRGSCPMTKPQKDEDDGLLCEKSEETKSHFCTGGGIRKKPVVVGTRIEKSVGGGMGRKYTTYRLPDGRLETVSEPVLIVEDVKKDKGIENIHEKKIERGEHRLDYIA